MAALEGVAAEAGTRGEEETDRAGEGRPGGAAGRAGPGTRAAAAGPCYARLQRPARSADTFTGCRTLLGEAAADPKVPDFSRPPARTHPLRR